MIVNEHLKTLLKRYPELMPQEDNIVGAFKMLEECFRNGGKLLVAGNGGSAADADHVVGELMKGFEKKRELSAEKVKELCLIDRELGEVLGTELEGALPAIALSANSALATAYMNDCNPSVCFAQQVYGLGKKEDVFLGISTSGNSKNILYAAVAAKARGLKVIGLTGVKDSKLSELADLTVRSANSRTYMIQEHHLAIYHCLCLMLEECFFGEVKKAKR